MFAPPPRIETEAWAVLPEHLRITEPRQPWKATRFSQTAHSFLEGPSFDRDGNLYIVDIAHGRILKVDKAGGFAVMAAYDGEPNGLKIHRDGTIFIADFRHGILRMDPRTNEIGLVLDNILGQPLKGPNDLHFARNGDLYFTDQGHTGLQDPTGRLVCLRADGQVEVLLDNVPSPNGLVLNKAETVLFLAVTRENAVWRVPLPPPGQKPQRVGVAVHLSGGNGPDGLAMDDDDTLYVAHTKLGSVWGFDKAGEPVCRIVSCRGADTTNLAFGGPDRRSVFITESATGTILRAEVGVPGAGMFAHM